MPHKFRSFLYSKHHAKVFFITAVVLAGTCASAFALTTAYKPLSPSSLPKPLQVTHVATPTKKATSSATTSPTPAPSSTPAATIQATPPASSSPPPTPKAAENPAASPATVASTGAAPGNGPTGLTATSGSTPPTTSSPAATCTNTPVSYSSTNWSGYAKTGCTFTDVGGSWTVPTPTGSSTQITADAAWIGIGGLNTSDLIQVGTEDTVDTDGTIYSAVFYELLPDAPVFPARIPVSPGDKVTAALHETNPGINQWLISLSNLTTGDTFSTTVQYVSGHGSVEWIEEDPSYADGSLVPFANFGSVTFTDATATGNGVVGDLSDASSITIVAAHRQVVAQPGAVSGSNNDTFTVTRQTVSGT